MKQINFVLTGMTHLRYYVPLALEAKKRSIQSFFYVSKSNKYNCPTRYPDILNNLKLEHEIILNPIEDLGKELDPIITIESDGKDYWLNKDNVFSINYCTDYFPYYKNYIDSINSLILPGNIFADKIDRSYRHKISAVGSPKFDTVIDAQQVRKKFNLGDDKYVTLFFPRTRDVGNFPIKEIIHKLNQMGYGVLIKSRKKDPVNIPVSEPNKIFYDTDWYPHTSMELIEISDFIINTSSMAAEETICLLKPSINYDIKPFDQTFPELFDNETNINRTSYDSNQFETDVKETLTKAIDKTKLLEVRDMFFNNVGNTSNKILDMIIK